MGGKPCCCIQVLGSRDSALRASPPVDPPTCIEPNIVISSSLHLTDPLLQIRFCSVWILLLRLLVYKETGLLTALLLLVNWQQAKLTLRWRQVAVAALSAFKLVGLFDFDFDLLLLLLLLAVIGPPPSFWWVVVLGISGAGPKGEVSTPGTASRRRLPSDPPP